MTQEKLRDRAARWAANNCEVNLSALTLFAREQLQKAVEIAKSEAGGSYVDAAKFDQPSPIYTSLAKRGDSKSY